GLKVVVKSGWVAARPSGTEDIYKVYAESFRREGHLQRSVKDAVTIISGAFEAAGIPKEGIK
ncbi:MAG: phosphoglucomutase, alpha-D-glucose phosphate-specific, partial [Proteobacteria bacterium]|nr:phosphoglucomutase, alpha-D-glucose phosphate-specific [Pseudomonadota bacterium]